MIQSIAVALQKLISVVIMCFCSQIHKPLNGSDLLLTAKQLSVAMGNLTVVLKGEEDLITDGSQGQSCNTYAVSRLHFVLTAS